MKILLALLLTASLHAQTTVASEYQGLTVPAGITLNAQYGCGTTWTPITIKGPQTQLQVYPGPLAGVKDVAGCLNVLQVFSGSIAIPLTVFTYGTSTTSASVTVPATTTTASPTTVTFPINGTCTTTYNAATNSLVLTIQ